MQRFVTLTVLVILVGYAHSVPLVRVFEKPANTSSPNNRPIIGILAQATAGYQAEFGDTYLYASYVKILESGGARVVPIRVKEPYSYYLNLLSKINGVLLPGGDVDPVKSHYAEAVKIIVNYSIQAYSKGDYFPIFSTCLGMQVLTVTIAGVNLLSATDADLLNLPLDFSFGYAHSRMFQNLPNSVHRILTTENITANAHHWGITPESFDRSSKLQKFFRILATNIDRKGKEFISAIEAHNYPIFGTQFHPEKPTYVWARKYPWDHSASAVLVTQYFANFYISQARQNYHHFSSEQEAYDTVIDRYRLVRLPFKEDPFEDMYVFNYTTVST